MLIVLVGLDGDAGKCGVARNIVRLAQVAVPGGEAALEQLDDVDLAASGGQRQKIEIVDVDITLMVRLGVLRIEHKQLVELLCALRAIFEHGAHGGIAIDIGVFPLDIIIFCILKGEALVDFHQTGIHFAHTGAFRTV